MLVPFESGRFGATSARNGRVQAPVPTWSTTVVEGLSSAASELRRAGYPAPALEGHLYRPLTALLATDPARPPGPRFWMGALAVHMVHEASLLHDDVLDNADRRRDRPTLQSRAGAARALLQGDRVLTAAYCAALRTEAPAFNRVFVEAVEATVAGEAGQAAARGKVLLREHYERIVEGKTGALFGVALATEALIEERSNASALVALGRQLGAFFQRVDDFLDYCPAAATGKPIFGDLRQRKWTWVLEPLGDEVFDLSEGELMVRLFGDGNGSGPGLLWESLAQLRRDADRITRACTEQLPRAPGVETITTRWVDFCANALAQQAGTRRGPVPAGASVTSVGNESLGPSQWVRRAALDVGGPESWPRYFSRNSRTFGFASRWFPAEARGHVTGLYAFCRFTDDLVDEHLDVPTDVRAARLDAWMGLARKAYAHEATGIPLIDVVLGQTRERGVPLTYAEELLEGVRMDLVKRRYATLAELRLYTFRVASVVGGWMTELFGSHDPWVLDRAHALGHAMQLTNIVRDVGEDLDSDRVYIPTELLSAHGLDEFDLRAMRDGDKPINAAYRALMKELMADADRHYEAAFRAIPALPAFFQKPVAVASSVYRGIQDEVVRNGYDNLTRRAHTSGVRKLQLSVKALRRLRTESQTLRAERGGLGAPGWIPRA